MTSAFPEEEFDRRLALTRERLADRGLDAGLVSSPENIFYLCGLDHWGYFAPHILVVPVTGEPVLVTRAMERVTIANQVRNVRFEGHTDSENAAEKTVTVLRAMGLAGSRLGLEKGSAGLTPFLAEVLASGLPGARWHDVSGLVDDLRLVKSPAEQDYIRQAAKVSDAAMRAAIDTIRDGAREAEIAAECHRAMILAGGTFPGFGPFIRPGARLGEEHTTWGDGVIRAGAPVFLELSGCVRRYHAPMGRLVHVGPAPRESREMETVCLKAFDAVVEALRPGVLARDVYRAWQRVVDEAGLAHYRRHHCGYLVGIGFPPTWTGGNKVTGLRHDSELEIRTGMAFHILSWLMGTGRGDYFVSNTVLLGTHGPEVLTRTPSTITEK